MSFNNDLNNKRILKISDKEYTKIISNCSPKIKIFKNSAYAFLFGGFICMLSEILRIYLVNWNLNKTDANVCISVIWIFIASLLTGLSAYRKIAKLAGAGTFIPITGFANAITSAALESKSEGLINGISSQIFTIAGPIIVFGIIFSAMAGVFFYALNLFGVDL